MAQELSFDLDDEPRAEGEAFCVDVDGFEGPLDLLLELARRQRSTSRESQYLRWPNNIWLLLKKRGPRVLN